MEGNLLTSLTTTIGYLTSLTNRYQHLCRFRCLYNYYFYPGLPNATSVQQETDLNDGPFKSVVRNNLREISSAFYAADLSKPSTSQRMGSSLWRYHPGGHHIDHYLPKCPR